MLTREFVHNVLETYGKAWETKDPNLIVTIFTEDATYHEKIMGPSMRGRKSIKRYWRNRVVAGQDNIEFKVLNFYIDGNVVIAEWEAYFDILKTSTRKHMKEIAILVFKGNKIKSLREYWSSRIVSKARNSSKVIKRKTTVKRKSLQSKRNPNTSKSTRIRAKTPKL